MTYEDALDQAQDALNDLLERWEDPARTDLHTDDDDYQRWTAAQTGITLHVIEVDHYEHMVDALVMRNDEMIEDDEDEHAEAIERNREAMIVLEDEASRRMVAGE